MKSEISQELCSLISCIYSFETPNNTQYMHIQLYIHYISKTINARIKTDSFGICFEFRTKLRSMIFNFLSQKIFNCRSKFKKISIFEKKNSVGRSSIIRIIRRKFKIWLFNLV